MLNREQRKVLRALNKIRKNRDPFNQANFMNLAKRRDLHKLIKLCETLERDGYLDRFATSKSDIVAIELSYKGMTYFSAWVKSILAAVFTWITDNLVSLAALIVSIIALVRSVS